MLTLLHSERPKLYTILAFLLSAKGLNLNANFQWKLCSITNNTAFDAGLTLIEHFFFQTYMYVLAEEIPRFKTTGFYLAIYLAIKLCFPPPKNNSKIGDLFRFCCWLFLA